MRAPLVLSAIAAFACSNSLGPPLSAFHDGRLPEAAAEFRLLEPEVAGFPRPTCARYALYRGLTHLGLGDARQADQWLTLAKRLERDHPEDFDATERGALYAAWRSLGRMPGDD
jgi:hypothetical protein